MANHKVSLTLPARVMLRTVNGEAVNLDMTKIPEGCLADILVGGIKIITGNTFNSGGADASEDEKLAKMMKRVDAWYRGEYVLSERGENAYTGMWNAFLAEQVAVKSTTEKVVETTRKDLVAKHFGEKSKNTAALFFQALAKEIAGSDGDESAILEAIEGKYAKLAEEKAQADAKAIAKIDVTDIGLDLAAFKKAK